MNSLKIGIIGGLILLPFLFISFVQVRQYSLAERNHMIVENAAARAMRDGVFALKTYSPFFYDAKQLRRIEIAEQATRETINRSFAYALNARTDADVEQFSRQIRLIGFVAYDGLILYDQITQERLEVPFYQIEQSEDAVAYRDLSLPEDREQPEGSRRLRPEQTLERILQPYLKTGELRLPEHTATLFGRDYSEVGVFILIQGDPLQAGQERSYFKLGKVSLSERKERE